MSTNIFFKSFRFIYPMDGVVAHASEVGSVEFLIEMYALPAAFRSTRLVAESSCCVSYAGDEARYRHGHYVD